MRHTLYICLCLVHSNCNLLFPGWSHLKSKRLIDIYKEPCSGYSLIFWDLVWFSWSEFLISFVCGLSSSCVESQSRKRIMLIPLWWISLPSQDHMVNGNIFLWKWERTIHASQTCAIGCSCSTNMAKATTDFEHLFIVCSFYKLINIFPDKTVSNAKTVNVLWYKCYVYLFIYVHIYICVYVCVCIYTVYIYTVPCESIHTPSFFSHFMLLPYVKLL